MKTSTEQRWQSRNNLDQHRKKIQGIKRMQHCIASYYIDSLMQRYHNYFRQWDYVYSSVYLFVSLSVSNITQNVINKLRWNFMDGPRVVKLTSDQILEVIWIMIWPWWKFVLCKCLEYDGCLWDIWWRMSFEITDSPNWESRQYGGNELLCWRYALSECSCFRVETEI